MVDGSYLDFSVISRLQFLGHNFVINCVFFVLRGYCNTPAQQIIEYHNDGNNCFFRVVVGVWDG